MALAPILLVLSFVTGAHSIILAPSSSRFVFDSHLGHSDADSISARNVLRSVMHNAQRLVSPYVLRTSGNLSLEESETPEAWANEDLVEQLKGELRVARDQLAEATGNLSKREEVKSVFTWTEGQLDR